MKPITTINPMLGDESFVAAFGRMPTELDDPQLRVATHVGYVARLLRARPTTAARRIELLDALDRYVAAGAFPTSETDHGLLPTFLDPTTGVRCAVAHLVETSAGTDTMIALDRDHHNAYIADLTSDSRFIDWSTDSGLTLEELEWIQPSYPPPPPPDVTYTVAADARVAIAHDDSPGIARTTLGETPRTITMLDAALKLAAGRQNPFYGKPTLEVDGAVGVAGSELAYDVEAKLGTEVAISRMQGTAISAGVALDAYGPSIPRAWTIPIETSYRFSFKHDAVTFHAGPRFAVSGVRELGWSTGVELRHRDLLGHEGRFSPRDLVIGVAATHLADAYFIGVTIGVGNPRARWWWED